MLRFARPSDPHKLAVEMSGVKMGDRFLQVACPNGGRLAAIAAKVGLSGRAVAIVPDAEAAARAQKGAANAGVLIEVEIAPPVRPPLDEADVFDLALIDDSEGLLGALSVEDRTTLMRTLERALRPGGRVMILAAVPRKGLGALLARGPSAPPFDPLPSLQAGGFKSVRQLAERDGLIFVEGIKPRTPS